jgi:hypothetical protein
MSKRSIRKMRHVPTPRAERLTWKDRERSFAWLQAIKLAKMRGDLAKVEIERGTYSP